MTKHFTAEQLNDIQAKRNAGWNMYAISLFYKVSKPTLYAKLGHKLKRDKYRDWGNCIKRKYGLSITSYELMLKEQNNACAICTIPFTDKSKYRASNIDHDHVTGKVRGLLCSRCNVGIGYYDNNNDILEKSLHYLAKFSNKNSSVFLPTA